MNTLLIQFPALLGVVIGATGSYVATSLTERSRWRRSQAVRWDEKRLAVYADYANSVKRLFQIAMRIAAHRGLPVTGEPLTPEAGKEVLAQAELDRATKFETVLLLGEPSVIIAARRWHSAAWKIDWYARDLIEDTDSFESDVKAANRARAEFYARVREDLGVRGKTPEPEPLDWAHPSKMRRRAPGDATADAAPEVW